jgi:hypothetical protein
MALLGVAFTLGFLAGCGDDDSPFEPLEPEQVHPDGSGKLATIQAAVDSALDGETVLLADGIFTGDGNRDIDFRGKAITVRSASGDPESCVIDCQGSADNPHRGFSFVTGETEEARLEGVTIRNGHTDAGGAVLCRRSRPMIVSCRIVGNTASAGGGLACDSSAASVISCLFQENDATSGGGIACFSSAPQVEDCRFLRNTATVGGGLYGVNASAPVFTDCVFEGNEAEIQGGAGLFHALSGFAELSRPLFAGTVFHENYGGDDTGALYFSAAAPTLIDCLFAGNAAARSGAVTFFGGEATVRGCTFVDNQARNELTPGGAAITCDAALSNAVVENTIVAFNYGTPAIFCSEGTEISFSCCDVYGNPGGDWVGSIAAQAGRDGNVSGNPLFCNAGLRDFRPNSLSPCAPANSGGCDLIGAFPAGCR